MSFITEPTKIKVILWDIDGTLLNFKEAEKYAIRKCFSIFQMGECDDSMLQTYSKINQGYWQKLEREEITKKEVLVGRFRDFFKEYHLDENKASEFNEEYQKRLGDTIVFFEDGLELVKEFKGKLLQYAVTNGTKIAQERKLKNSGLDKLLDGIFISEDVGCEKPGIGFFTKVFEEIGNFSQPEILIVGDSLTSDIRGGVNAGIKTCWFNPDKESNTTDLRIDYEISRLKEIREIVF
ncbi:MAG: YjjG family noncanonical pyrimidine nucleotidase [Lachnospiraceae bacterium]|nr:YjjG family noncanonical pyrimidine nucleotidase [Lachnospiraceae bacterium]